MPYGFKIRDPDVGLVERHAGGSGANVKSVLKETIAGSQPGNGAEVDVGNPNAGAVKFDSKGRRTRLECALGSTVTRPQFAHCAAELVRDPDAAPVKGELAREGAHRKDALDRAIAGPQFGHCVTELVCHPDVGAVEGDSKRAKPSGEGAKESAIAGSQLRDGAAGDIGHPDIRPVKERYFGSSPTGNVPRIAPSLARSLVTASSISFAIQMLAPSNANPSGEFPAGKVWIESGAPDCCAIAGSERAQPMTRKKKATEQANAASDECDRKGRVSLIISLPTVLLSLNSPVKLTITEYPRAVGYATRAKPSKLIGATPNAALRVTPSQTRRKTKQIGAILPERNVAVWVSL